VSDTTLFAGTSGDGVLLSTDNAKSWKFANQGLSDTIVYSFVQKGSDLYAATENGVFLSTDMGQNWESIFSGLSGTPVQTLSLCQSELFAGTETGGLFRLNDEGNAWLEVDMALEKKNIITLATIDDYLLAATFQGVFLSKDLGTTWEAFNTGLGSSVVLYLEKMDSVIYAGSRGSGVWKRSLSDMTSDIDDRQQPLPMEFVLHQNYPNPFNPTTKINYELPITNYVELTIYSILGRRIATLVSQQQKAGHHQVELNALGLASGVYYYRLEAGGFVDVKKMVLLR
jgi:hypothetical protein